MTDNTTPRPWHAKGNHIETGQERTIADVYGAGESDDVRLANAALIVRAALAKAKGE